MGGMNSFFEKFRGSKKKKSSAQPLDLETLKSISNSNKKRSSRSCFNEREQIMKGLSLEQLRSELESDAQKRCEAQEKTIKEQQEKIREQEATIKRLYDDLCHLMLLKNSWIFSRCNF